MLRKNLRVHEARSIWLAVLACCCSAAAHAQFVEPGVEVLAAFSAENAGDGFGFVAETIGDINDDGAPDYIIGAPGFPAGASNGKVYVYSGANGSLLHSIEGSRHGSLGFSVAGIGDVNDDDVPDYAVGEPFTSNGGVLIVSGADHQVIRTVTSVAGALFGYDINSAGDVDHDGSGDIVVGAPAAGATGEGAVSVVSGKTGAFLWTQPGTTFNASLGSGVSGMGDVNGDLVPDQVVGAFTAGDTATGLAFMMSGVDGSVIHTLEPLPTAGSFGWFFAHAAGDVDGDGVPDSYVGDFGDTALGPGSGRAYIHSGADGSRLQVYDAEFSGDGFGIGRGAGDINGDGRPDMFLAAYTNGQGASFGGKGYLYSGRDQGLIRSLTGTTVNGQLGFDAVPVGDVNKDGFDDYLLTGLEIAFTIAGSDAAPGARIDSVCALLAAVPDDAWAPHAQVRRNRLCTRLADARKFVENGRYLAAGRLIDALVLRRMDAVIGGQSEDDWIVAPEWQQFVVPWVQGIKTMTVSLHEDR